jgi:hypothetical protein
MVIHLLKKKGHIEGLLCTNAFIKGATTTDKNKVTCLKCKAIIKKRKL